MKTDNFIISLKTAKLLYVFSVIFFLISLRASKNGWESSEVLLISATVLFLFLWVGLFIEMLKNKFYNRTFWLLSMVFIPPIAILFYLIQRKRLYFK